MIYNTIQYLQIAETLPASVLNILVQLTSFTVISVLPYLMPVYSVEKVWLQEAPRLGPLL